MNIDWIKGLWGAAPMDPYRWVVLDVETTGLNTRKASLIEIAAICIHLDPVTQTLKIDLADSFEIVLKQQASKTSDKENILLHGIGVQAQKAVFDEAMIQKTFKQFLGRKIKNAWIDIEPLVAKCHPEVKAKYMDDWMQFLGIECAVRHQAAADTFATAEIMMQIWPLLRQHVSSIEDVEQLEKRLRKLPRH
jgi:DNA polymerase-3 subunit epsilon